MSRELVRPSAIPLSDLDVREKLAPALLALSQAHGPTRLGALIGCHEKTIREARDEKATLGLALAFNLLLADETALDPLLAHFGHTSIAQGSVEDEDAALDEAATEALSFAASWAKARAGGKRLCGTLRASLKAQCKRVKAAASKAARS